MAPFADLPEVPQNASNLTGQRVPSQPSQPPHPSSGPNLRNGQHMRREPTAAQGGQEHIIKSVARAVHSGVVAVHPAAAFGLKRCIPTTLDRIVDKIEDKVEKFTNHGKGKSVLEGQLAQALEPCFPSATISKGPLPEMGHRNADFIRISELLQTNGKMEWSQIPRTFAILYRIGCIEAIEEFISESRSDFYLPYNARTLPNCVKGKARNLFLDYQLRVLNQNAAELEKEGGDHQYFQRSANDCFIPKKELGTGLHGRVDEVVSRLSLRMFARKRIKKGQSFQRDGRAMKSFENELKVLKSLSHKHLVKLVGSYSDPHYVGFIMTPVADCNLQEYLIREFTAVADVRERQICIRRFFGCLSTAVAFLHENTTRHRDIKPGNILIKDKNVFLADFGASHNWGEDDRSVTSGTVDVLTWRYCAPEVAKSAVSPPSLQIILFKSNSHYLAS